MSIISLKKKIQERISELECHAHSRPEINNQIIELKIVEDYLVEEEKKIKERIGCLKILLRNSAGYTDEEWLAQKDKYEVEIETLEEVLGEEK